MVQFFYRWESVKIAKVDERSVASVYDEVSTKEGIPVTDFILLLNGRILHSNDSIEDNCCFDVTLRLLGGKGGFGNMLKKKAKVANPNAILDFSACRDLNGRRMRFVNAANAIQKWKERMDRLEDLKSENPDATIDDVELEAPKAGIYGWYSDVPNWAEGVKRSRTTYLRDKKKQKMCDRWLKARENVPPNADKHWGCPRRDMCDFAHGIDELTGEGKAAYLREQERQKKEKEREAVEIYTTYDSMSNDAKNAVEAGLKLKAKDKKIHKKLDLSPLESDDFGFTSPSKKAKIAPKTSSRPSVVVSDVGVAFAERLSLICGNASIQDDGIITALSSFPSIRLGNISVVTGLYYFEIHMITEGLVQVGWCGNRNECNEQNENGVGDCTQSWAFDMARGKRWHADADGEAFGEACQPGDIIGILLDADKKTISISINGKDFGIAFSGVSANGGLFPAISLEMDEAVLVNLGQFPFEFEPLVKVTSVWEFAKRVKM